jgi:hypothetical protein
MCVCACVYATRWWKPPKEGTLQTTGTHMHQRPEVECDPRSCCATSHCCGALSCVYLPRASAANPPCALARGDVIAQVYIMDLDSVNGTMIGKTKCRPNRARLLRVGDMVRPVTRRRCGRYMHLALD